MQTLLNAQGQRRALSKSATLTIGSTGISCSQVTRGSFASTSAISRRGGEAERRDPPPPAAQPGFYRPVFIRRAVGQADGTQGIGLLSAQQQRVKILHLLDQAVSDGGDDDQAFSAIQGRL